MGIYFIINIFNDQVENEETVGANVQKVLDANKLVIGTDATYPPMESEDENGNLIGYDIDLGKRVAESLGVVAEFKNISWDEVFGALVNGEVDIIISGVTITNERKELYDFSSAYINAGMVIITQEANTTISSTDDLSDKKIAVQKETTNQEEALKYTDTENVLEFDDFEAATEALIKGDADAIFSDLTNAKGIIDDNPTLKIASAPFTDDNYGIVIKKGKPDLVEKINEVLDSLRQQGYLLFLQQKWLE